MTSNPLVTLVVVPRERFSQAERTIAAIYEHTPDPFRMVVVSGGTPAETLARLRLEAGTKGFELIEAGGFRSPNQARNLGLERVQTKYVAFVDNDALVTRGWLRPLIDCAEETGADVVGPLYLIGDPSRRMIHMAGGTLTRREFDNKPYFYDEQYLFDTPIDKVQAPLHRQRWDYVEFHAMLVRTSVFKRLGPMDERLLSHHEHIDVCLSVRKAGGSVYIEPLSCVSYLTPPPWHWSDLPYFMVRWCESWNASTVEHFSQKWGISFVRFFKDDSPIDAGDTNLRWARAQRRRIVGLRVARSHDGSGPSSPLEEAQIAAALLQTIDRQYFDLSVDGEAGVTKHIDPPDLFERLPALLDAAGHGRSIRVRPIHDGRSEQPLIIRVADLDDTVLDRIRPHSLVTMETGPNRYECWLPVTRGNWRSGAQLKKLTGASSLEPASDAWLTIAGAARFLEGSAGMLNTVHQLQESAAAAYLGRGQIC